MSRKLALIAAVVIGMVQSLPGSGAADVVGDLRDAVARALREQQAPPPPPPVAATPAPAPTQPRSVGAASPPPPSAEERVRRAAERRLNMAVQSALNGFGFEVGAVDGDLGRRSQAAIAAFQSYMGYPPTGALEEAQRRLLLEGDRRLRAGEAARYPGIVAAEGARGLLKVLEDPEYAAGFEPPPAPLPARTEPPAPAPETPPPPIETVSAPDAPDADPAVEIPAPDAAAEAEAPMGPLDLPELSPSLGRAASMADRCEIVELTTATNQGPIQAATMSDPSQALSEQFCAARSYAVAAGENIARDQADPARLLTACERISTAMAPVRAALARETPDEVTARAAAASGRMNARTAASYGEICLGFGYRRDDAEMALSAGLLLVGAGRTPYAEVIGHHLREGFGVAAAPEAARAWYAAALAALEADSTPAFLPSRTRERIAIIRAATGGQTRAAGPAPVSGLVPAAQPLTEVEVLTK